MKQIFIHSSVIAVLLFLGASIGSAQVTGTIDKVWVEYGVRAKGESGIRIHTKFSLKNALNAECTILATIRRADGESMAFTPITDLGQGRIDKAKPTYNTYATKDGKTILMLKPFTSPYDKADYPGTTLFFPDWALQMRGDNQNKMKLFVTISSGGKEFVRSAIIEFSRPVGKF